MLPVGGRASLAALLTVLAGGSAPAPAPLAVGEGLATLSLRRAAVGAVAARAAWQRGQGGLEWTEVDLHGRGETRRIRVVVARLDPRGFRFSLENGIAPGGYTHVWTVDRAPAAAALAVNAGQFAADGAWGWVVHAGNEYRAPRQGPLAAAVVIDTAGAVRLLDDAALAALRTDSMPVVREAFQSYPMLLDSGAVLPQPLRRPGLGLDLEHRDARLALGLDGEGRVVLALTRFDVLGPAFGVMPFGLTLVETADLMRGLGCDRAVALDGGISAQLLLRDGAGEPHRWPGLRPVPLGLSAVTR